MACSVRQALDHIFSCDLKLIKMMPIFIFAHTSISSDEIAASDRQLWGEIYEDKVTLYKVKLRFKS